MSDATENDECYVFKQSELDAERNALIERQRAEWKIMHDMFFSGLNNLNKHHNLKLADAYMGFVNKLAGTLTHIQEGERASYSLYAYEPSREEIRDMSDERLNAILTGKIIKATVP